MPAPTAARLATGFPRPGRGRPHAAACALGLLLLALGGCGEMATLSVADGTATHLLNPGDVMLTRGHRPCVFADSPQTPTDVRILPGQECVDPHGRILRGEMNLGVRTWATFPPTPRTPPSCSSGPTPARHRSAQGFSLNFRTTW